MRRFIALVALVSGIAILGYGKSEGLGIDDSKQPLNSLQVSNVLQLHTVGKKIDLNRATIPELITVPGIGPRLAKDIVARRVEKGPFLKWADLTEVRGIGLRKLAVFQTTLEISPPDKKR